MAQIGVLSVPGREKRFDSSTRRECIGIAKWTRHWISNPIFASSNLVTDIIAHLEIFRIVNLVYAESHQPGMEFFVFQKYKERKDAILLMCQGDEVILNMF